MPKAIDNSFRTVAGDRASTYEEVLAHAVRRIVGASKKGTGLRLSAEEVRALDWAVIRESGDHDTTPWLDGSFAEIGIEPER